MHEQEFVGVYCDHYSRLVRLLPVVSSARAIFSGAVQGFRLSRSWFRRARMDQHKIRDCRVCRCHWDELTHVLSSGLIPMFVNSQQDGIKFSTPGELGTAHVTVRQHTAVKKAVGPGFHCWD